MWPFTKPTDRDARPTNSSRDDGKPPLAPKPASERSDSAPVRRRLHRLQDHPAEAHGRELLRWLQDPDFDHRGQLRTKDIQDIYAEVCLHLDWRQRPWNPVAREFARLTTDGRK